LDEAAPTQTGEPGDSRRAVFTHGSTMRHVLVMSATGGAGLVAVFFVDLANLLYISMLGQQELAAAVGYAATAMFFTISVCIGLSIAATAITARAIGAKDIAGARKNAGASMLYTLALTTAMTALLFPLLSPVLELLGAKGETHAIALTFMQIVMPSVPILGLGMCGASLLRAKGDARRSMYVTLVAAFAAALIDPLLIFGLGLGVNGAAIATVIVRFIMLLVALHGLVRVHDMMAIPDRAHLRTVLWPFLAIALPAVLTQIATPVGNAYVTSAIARFGDDAVAGWAIVGRIIPLAFAGLYSMSGAVGPILAQNLGAGLHERLVATMRDSLLVTAAYTMAMWALLAALTGPLIALFGATGDAALLLRFFCFFVAGSFMFNGALFVANAAFNNLGFPVYSTVFNWGRATLGVIPFVHFGMAWGPEGVLAGWGIGAIAFGLASIVVCFRVLGTLPHHRAIAEPKTAG
jgi:putative MATE family efflux protein